ncbi:hypothetical protein Vadar_024257 [Vaccinium darrowii]|uniref:Uncharacterized protein n=1 Tax=Vaccinium darrowii TaxID=229202 RepID=A0ACB7YQH4_9ERIC|nr:hypothetical protein Vadar_024257 [Vaccinium darrowii]
MLAVIFSFCGNKELWPISGALVVEGNARRSWNKSFFTAAEIDHHLSKLNGRLNVFEISFLSLVKLGFECEQEGKKEKEKERNRFCDDLSVTRAKQNSHGSYQSTIFDNYTAEIHDESGIDLKDQNLLLARWLHEPDKKDRLSASHSERFSDVLAESRADARNKLCRKSIFAESSMLHQESFMDIYS